MIRILGTIFAGLAGLCFGSFLNVCLSRWPEGESIVAPRSHCRNCDRALAWWENVPLLSWLGLRGRCRGCKSWIGWRYPLVEFSVAVLWALQAWNCLHALWLTGAPAVELVVADAIGKMIFDWLLIALAVLDAENLWLPNMLTWPGIVLGFLFTVVLVPLEAFGWSQSRIWRISAVWSELLGILAAAGLIFLIRWAYWLVRRREGIGLGDAKLMALLAAWLGLPGALFAFGLGAILGALAAVVLLVTPSARRDPEGWAETKLPLGTFLCVGGIVSSLWGQPLIHAYMRWAGF